MLHRSRVESHQLGSIPGGPRPPALVARSLQPPGCWSGALVATRPEQPLTLPAGASWCKWGGDPLGKLTFWAATQEACFTDWRN